MCILFNVWLLLLIKRCLCPGIFYSEITGTERFLENYSLFRIFSKYQALKYGVAISLVYERNI
jgi:hypothetical protein